MQMIMATIEGDSFAETIEFSSDEVVAHHMPGGAHGWEDLSEADQEGFSEDYALWKFARQYGNNAELRVSVEIQDGYRFIPIESGKYEVYLLVDGVQCPGRMGVLTGRPGNWEAEWVDGSRVGTFDTLQDGAKALENYRYHV